MKEGYPWHDVLLWWEGKVAAEGLLYIENLLAQVRNMR
jgi:hypothetical protein